VNFLEQLANEKENDVSLTLSRAESDLEKNLPKILTCRLRRVKPRAIADHRYVTQLWLN
jgi:hypothetical protein